MKKHLAVWMASLAVLLFAATASAQGYVFDGNLAPGNETPPLDTGMGGLCVATVVGLDAGGSQALIVMSAFGNDTRITAAHIHDGAAAVAGPGIYPLFTAGDWTHPAVRLSTFHRALRDKTLPGNTYSHVHTPPARP